MTKRRKGHEVKRRRSNDVQKMLEALTEGPSAPAEPSQPASLGPSQTLQISKEPGETSEGMRARTALRPALRAAYSIAAHETSFADLDLTTLVDKLAEQVDAVKGGDLGRAEEMLVAQAHTLDMVFHQLLHRSVKNIRGGYMDAGETYMRLALRTQSQCRATLETLSVVKHPPAVAFVRQANIANGPQQVNNGTVTPQPATPRAREIPQTQLLEQHPHERLDTGTAQAAGRGDPAMATLGKLNGAVHARG